MGTLVPIDAINERWLWRCQEPRCKQREILDQDSKSKISVKSLIATPTSIGCTKPSVKAPISNRKMYNKLRKLTDEICEMASYFNTPQFNHVFQELQKNQTLFGTRSRKIATNHYQPCYEI
jgi:hypothetical protein